MLEEHVMLQFLRKFDEYPFLVKMDGKEYLIELFLCLIKLRPADPPASVRNRYKMYRNTDVAVSIYLVDEGLLL